jgi:hypothetical protein
MNTTQEILARARSATHHATNYQLGRGGLDPNSPSPADDHACDCSGFICWCFSIARRVSFEPYYSFNRGWVNTDSIVRDAMTSGALFTRISEPLPGAVIVYPSRNGRYGHIGIVSEVTRGPTGVLVPAKVIHCSEGNQTRFGDAIAESAPVEFNDPAVIYAQFATHMERDSQNSDSSRG